MTVNAILCEGAAEQAIMTILIEQNVLTIKKILYYSRMFIAYVVLKNFSKRI